MCQSCAVEIREVPGASGSVVALLSRRPANITQADIARALRAMLHGGYQGDAIGLEAQIDAYADLLRRA